jgi:endonuclease/exonuclease/phosphatase family metal-dependent hydrolase
MKSAVILLAALLVFGCVVEVPESPANQTPQENTTIQENEIFLTGENITIAAFNIQVFGKSKASKDDVMEILAKTARNFDIIAVQEIRDSSQTSLPKLVEKINSLDGPDYDYTVGPRLGRTSSKEQYAYIYKQGITLLGNTTFNDSDDAFHREPYLARFKAGDFDFVLIALHSDPDETPEELDSLPLVLEEAKETYEEDDFILLGDMNADCNYLKKSDNVSIKAEEYIWLIGDDADTTVKSTDCAYDRIIIMNSTLEEYSGMAGIFRFDEEYNLNQSMSESVSDHYPVWATFITSQEQEE